MGLVPAVGLPLLLAFVPDMDVPAPVALAPDNSLAAHVETRPGDAFPSYSWVLDPGGRGRNLYHVSGIDPGLTELVLMGTVHADNGGCLDSVVEWDITVVGEDPDAEDSVAAHGTITKPSSTVPVNVEVVVPPQAAIEFRTRRTDSQQCAIDLHLDLPRVARRPFYGS
ncbi:hypothetical protein V5P93_000989 [Actinokineospora auranticolor]|uniref:Uncharacterized protein n=1 Tax=Actinokineospora auranticolor TaxID=155976 RepID=A0A2S6GY34_9PSEU|nr:hypothetical protein [Actinokineospora auranticolor]PPK70133.1 hypothetical protein CLV40_10243 [Actinokineospora auranticolor]